MTVVEPGQRALALVFAPDSSADNNRKIYAHYPAWYQAEHQGLVAASARCDQQTQQKRARGRAEVRRQGVPEVAP